MAPLNLSDVVRSNPRLVAGARDIVAGFQPYLDGAPTARIYWVEEYARAVVGGAAHRAGMVAMTKDSLVLSWKHGALYRKRSLFAITRRSVTSWRLEHRQRFVAETPEGELVIEFRPDSPEYESFAERLALIRPLGGLRD